MSYTNFWLAPWYAFSPVQETTVSVEVARSMRTSQSRNPGASATEYTLSGRVFSCKNKPSARLMTLKTAESATVAAGSDGVQARTKNTANKTRHIRNHSTEL